VVWFYVVFPPGGNSDNQRNGTEGPRVVSQEARKNTAKKSGGEARPRKKRKTKGLGCWEDRPTRENGKKRRSQPREFQTVLREGRVKRQRSNTDAENGKGDKRSLEKMQ